jgi:hypothetical protein
VESVLGVQTDTARNIHRSDHTERRLPTAPRGCCVRKATGTGANEQRGPLLLIAGGEDHVVPAAVDAQAAKKYGKSRAVTDFKEFPGRSHFGILGGRGWEEVADYARPQRRCGSGPLPGGNPKRRSPACRLAAGAGAAPDHRSQRSGARRKVDPDDEHDR